ncbi:MAG: cytochrome b/b6 domain-containing protein [Paracoccus sp. (in: a-proteobacteria)]|nr:cytochrome b/b6 domain-containing protein [Paracoccus sp. (in: a-proteobacteria)]
MPAAGPDLASAPLPPGVTEAAVWDPFLRLYHWLLAISVAGAWILGSFGGAMGITRMTLHFWFGYMVIALLAFRLVWGVIGPGPARFAQFLRGPGAVMDYARHMGARRPSYWPGHNPLGALSVVAMMAALAAQVATGLIADPNDFVNYGPLSAQVSAATSRAAVGWHDLGANIVLALVVLHVAVILFYRWWKREDLIRPMITGRKLVRRED